MSKIIVKARDSRITSKISLIFFSLPILAVLLVLIISTSLTGFAKNSTNKISSKFFATNPKSEAYSKNNDLLAYDAATSSTITPAATTPTEIPTYQAPNMITQTATPSPTPTSTPTPSSQFFSTQNSIPSKSSSFQYAPAAYPNATPVSPRVMVVGYNPIESGQSVADRYYGGLLGGKTADQAMIDAFQDMALSVKQLTNNLVNYQIVYTTYIRAFQAYDDGYKFNSDTYVKCVWGNPLYDQTFCENKAGQFSYTKWEANNSICTLARIKNIDEIWVMSLPGAMTWESFMLGPNPGYSLNGGHYVSSRCMKHYPVLSGTYERIDMLFHNYGHRVESTLDYLTSNWTTEDRQNYFLNFDYIHGTRPAVFCGNGHLPANGSDGYDYYNMSFADFNCIDWKNFPDLTGATENFNCLKWGCSDAGWQKYFISNIPNGGGDVTLTSATNKQFKVLRNWWMYVLYPDRTLTFVKTTI